MTDHEFDPHFRTRERLLAEDDPDVRLKILKGLVEEALIRLGAFVDKELGYHWDEAEDEMREFFSMKDARDVETSTGVVTTFDMVEEFVLRRARGATWTTPVEVMLALERLIEAVDPSRDPGGRRLHEFIGFRTPRYGETIHNLNPLEDEDGERAVDPFAYYGQDTVERWIIRARKFLMTQIEVNKEAIGRYRGALEVTKEWSFDLGDLDD